MAVPGSARPFGSEPLAFLRPGTWLVDCGPRLVHFTSEDTYVIDDQGNLAVSPADSGTFEQNDDTVTFTSGEDSEGCEAGFVLVIEEPVTFDAPLGNRPTRTRFATKPAGTQTPESMRPGAIQCRHAQELVSSATVSWWQ
jgi:hypothetical protein